MHVVIATGLYPPEIGGPATFSVFLEKGLKEKHIGCTVVPFSSVRHLPKVIRHISYFIKVLRTIRHGSVVLALDPVSVGFPALLAARLRGAPFYLRAGGDYAWEQAVQRWGFKGLPEEFPGTFPLPFAGRVLVWTERYVARHARRILTQSGHLASIVVRWGVSSDMISVVPNSVSLPSLPTRAEARKQFNFGDEPVIVSSGRFVPWKGFNAVIHGYSIVQKDFNDARLVLAGDGPERAALASENHAVQFLGPLSKEKLFALLRAADVFVLNTRYEGFSHQILEAMATGVPIVTTNIPGNRDLAENGKTALLVAFNDVSALAAAIKRLLSDKNLTESVVREAKSRASIFTPERTFNETCRAIGIQV